MNITAFISTVSLVIFLIFGLYVLLINARNSANILFFAMMLSLAFLSLSSFFAAISVNEYVLFYCMKISVFFIIMFFGVLLHFFIELTVRHKRRIFFIIMLYLPVIFMVIKYSFSNDLLYIRAVRENGLWMFIFLNSFWTYLLYGYFMCYASVVLILVFLWGYRSGLKKVKYQARIILILFLVLVLLMLLDTFILPLFFPYKTLGIKHVLLLIWISGIFYAINKYRFLALTTEFVSNLVLSGIDEAVILLDNNLKIFFINKKTETLTGEDKAHTAGRDLSEFIENYELIKAEMNRITGNHGRDFFSRLYFKTKNQPVLMDFKISKVADRFGDAVGILIIGSEVKEIKQLKLYYRLSDREIEIVQYIAEGLSNKEICGNTGLTGNTVKSHIRNIFAKLKVGGRIEMINLLMEYNLIPRAAAGRKIVLVK